MITGHIKNSVYTGISIDTRTLCKDNLFIAIKGEHFDGHDYIYQAEEKGAAGVIAAEPVQTKLPVLRVDNTVDYLGKITSEWREKFSLPVIGLTGSNGKTTTKNMIAEILKASRKPVLATKGNLNNHLGVPLTLASLNAEHAYAVIEMGMNHTGEIAYLTQLVKPTIALITNAGSCHLEGVTGQNIAGVAAAKGEIFEGLAKNGLAIINQDDNFAEAWKTLIYQKNSVQNTAHKILTFGLDQSSDIWGEIISSHVPDSILVPDLIYPVMNTFILHDQRKSKKESQKILIHLKLAGRHNIYNALAASAAGISLGFSLSDIKRVLEELSSEKGRMEFKTGFNQATIIDDTYNANPLSLKAAIQAVYNLKNYQKKILVLGDMKELGEQAVIMHRECGEYACLNGIDILLGIGELTRHAVKGFGKQAQHFETQEALVKFLKQHNYCHIDNLILIKGSRSMSMDNIVKAIL